MIRSRTSDAQCTAVIADVVNSRGLSEVERRDLQSSIDQMLQSFNQAFKQHIVSRFVLTIGDEFQGLIGAPQMIPELLWRIESDLRDVAVRVGVGFGTISTTMRAEAVGMDGPAFHLARSAIGEAKANKELGGVFRGFGSSDTILNGFARVLWFQRSRWTVAQRETVSLLRTGLKQNDISAALLVTQQAVSQRTRGAGWEPYRAAERGWQECLTMFDTSDQWVRR